MLGRGAWARIAAVVGAAVAIVLTTAAVAVAFDAWHWGCRSQAELERWRPSAEVTASFAHADVQLTPGQLTGGVVGTDVPYRNATAHRYDGERATLWVLVCRGRCASAPRTLDRRRPVDGRYVRQFSTLGNNVAIFTADNDRRSGRELQDRVQRVVNELDVAEEYGGRCYVQ